VYSFCQLLVPLSFLASSFGFGSWCWRRGSRWWCWSSLRFFKLLPLVLFAFFFSGFSSAHCVCVLKMKAKLGYVGFLFSSPVSVSVSFPWLFFVYSLLWFFSSFFSGLSLVFSCLGLAFPLSTGFFPSGIFSLWVFLRVLSALWMSLVPWFPCCGQRMAFLHAFVPHDREARTPLFLWEETGAENLLPSVQFLFLRFCLLGFFTYSLLSSAFLFCSYVVIEFWD